MQGLDNKVAPNKPCYRGSAVSLVLTAAHACAQAQLCSYSLPLPEVQGRQRQLWDGNNSPSSIILSLLCISQLLALEKCARLVCSWVELF